MLAVEPEFMVFLEDGAEAIGAVRQVLASEIVIYVENGGDFPVPMTAIRAVHEKKVVLEASKLDRRLLEAIGHQHDAEDPNLAG